MNVSLLISTYNWPEALSLVLASVKQQSRLPDELLIADDGSGAATKAVIDAFAKEVPFPVKHFWHEDIGFTKSIILNKAVAGAAGEYIIQIDGDCILHKDLVRDHYACASANQYLYGSRVNIKEGFVTQVMNDGQTTFHINSKQIKNKTRSLRVPALSSLYTSHEGISGKFRGCNCSFWREDFIAVNGYNEAMTGWGKEDSELMIRMGNNGVRARRLRYRGIVYHIWHKVFSKKRLPINQDIQQETIATNRKWCEQGVAQYL